MRHRHKVHTSFCCGKRVLVILRSGERFVSRYVETLRDKVLVFEDRRVNVADVRSANYWRTGTSTPLPTARE